MGQTATGTAEALLAGLDPEQREVALAARGPVCVLAGAGTGKTRAITYRIAYAAVTGVQNPAHVLALTFTARAAGELRGRLRMLGAGAGLGASASPGTGASAGTGAGIGAGAATGASLVRASTFHAAALRQLNYFWPKVVGGRPPQLIDSKGALVREAARRAKVRVGGGSDGGRQAGVSDAASEIEWAKVGQVRPDGYAAAAAAAGRSAAGVPGGYAAMAEVFAAYEDLRRERHLIDFESVLELTAAILLDSRVAADQVRDTFRHFVVDEYQDTTPLQKLLLDAWLGDRDDLCVVGDPHQVIYSFTGATPAFLTGFTAEFPDAAVVRLVRDYRSTPQVVAVANQLARAEVPLVAQRPAGPRPVLTAYPDDAAEAAGVAVQVRALLGAGVPSREIAVLVRINAETERFESALADGGVPYLLRGTERFYDRPVVRQALVLLRGAARGAAAATDDGAPDTLPAAVRHVLSSIGLGPSAPPARTAPASKAPTSTAPTSTAPTSTAPATGGAAARERWESLAAIIRLADDMAAARPEATLADFSAELTLRAELGHAPAADGVTLASMHAAKGLEWDAVLLPGLVEGLMPIVYARTPEGLAEERRLLYVAVTRAREHLYLSWAPARTPEAAARGATRDRSRFLDGLRLGR